MRKVLGLLALALCSLGAHAAVCTTLAGSPSQATLQAALNSCGSGNTLQLSAGTTTLASDLTMACGVLVTGPATTLQSNGLYTAPTASLHGTPPMDAFNVSGGCTPSTTWGFENLNFNFTAPATFDASSYSNFVFEFNTVTNLPHDDNGGFTSSLWFGGNVANTLSGITIEHNSFGDINSCIPPPFNTLYTDPSCAGIHVFDPGTVLNMTIEYNTFFHLNEGIQFNTNSGVPGGNTVSVAQNLLVEYNYFAAISRNFLENQVSTQFAPTIMSNNVFNASGAAGDIATSGACCNSGSNSAVPSDQNPSVFQENNIAFQPDAIVCSGGVCTAGFAQLGNEGYGNSPTLNHNMVQGNYCTGATWSPGVSQNGGSNAGSISYNIFQIPWPSEGFPGNACAGGTQYTGPEGPTNPTPSLVGNVEGPTPSALTSVAPTISPASSAQTFPLTVTLTDLGQTSSTQAGPLGNTGIWYTTDGSTPTPGASCTSPCGYLPTGGTFTLASAATVKAVGMWGAPPQPTSYPAGFGFVPSVVVSAVFTGGTPTTAAPTFSPASESFFPTVAVSLSSTTSGASIFFCVTSGCTPTTSSTHYTAPITISSTTTINAIATASGLANSGVASSTYTLNLPTLTGCSQANTGSVNTLLIGGTAQQQVFTQYGSTILPIPTGGGSDTNLTAVSAWTSDGAAISVGAVGSGTPGLVTGTADGTNSAHVSVSQNGGAAFPCSEWTFTVSGSPTTPSSVTVTLLGGGSNISLGTGTGQMCANMQYATQNTTVCGSGLDIFGNGPGSSWQSLGTGIITSTTAGLLNGVTNGNATIKATVGSFTPTLNVTVTGTLPPSADSTFSNMKWGHSSVQ